MRNSIKTLLATTSLAVMFASTLVTASEVDRLNGETFAREYARQVEAQARTRTAADETASGYENQVRERTRQREQSQRRSGQDAATRGQGMGAGRSSQAAMGGFSSRPVSAGRPAGGFSRGGMR